MNKTKEVDERFKVACLEIEQILRKHDLGATVFLASDKGTHFYHALDTPSWSCLRIEETEAGTSLRVKASSKIPGDQEKLALTVNMVGFFADMMINSASNFSELESMIGSHVTIERKSHIGKEPDWSPT